MTKPKKIVGYLSQIRAARKAAGDDEFMVEGSTRLTGSAADWHKRAELAQTKAAKMSTAQGRDWVLDVAALYRRLADQAALTAARPAS